MPPKNAEYRYRPVYEDEVEVRELLEKWAGAAVHFGLDIGTKELPTGTPTQRKKVVAEARVVFEALGLLPAGFEPPPEDEGTTRLRRSTTCRHVRCKHCDRCRCHDVFVRGRVCEECKWDEESRSVAGQEKHRRMSCKTTSSD